MQDLFVEDEDSGSGAEDQQSEAVSEPFASHTYARDPLRACSTAAAAASLSPELPPTWNFSHRSPAPTTKEVEQLYEEVRAMSPASFLVCTVAPYVATHDCPLDRQRWPMMAALIH